MELHENEQNVNGLASASATAPRPAWRWLAAVPERLLVRALVLFGLLALIKCGIIFSFRKELFQTHWRFMDEEPNWMNQLAFYTFAILVGLNLRTFARKCAAISTMTMRTALVIVAGLSVLFIALTFHEGDKNYLAPVINGVLQWGDLGSYFSMNLFFRPPYLAGWVSGGAMLYYGLVRSGREHLVPEVVGMVACAYLMLHLREFTRFRAELLVLDALGLASLMFGRGTNRPLKWPFALAPYGLMAVFFFLFAGQEPNIARPNPEFMILALPGAVLFLGASLLAWRRGFYAPWSWLLCFASASFLLLTTANFHLADNYRSLMLTGLTLPRYFLGETILVSALVLVGVFYHRQRPQGTLMWWDIVGLGAVAMAIVDWRLAQIMGVRLDWQVLAFGDSPKMMWRMAKPYLPMLSLGLLGVAGLYAILVRGLTHQRTRQRSFARPVLTSRHYAGFAALLLAITGLGVVQADRGEGQVLSSLVKTSPVWKRLSQPMWSGEKFHQTARELGMESMLAGAPARPSHKTRDLNVILIFQESVYNQHLPLFGGTNETQPLLSRYRDRMELFPNFFSNFAGSIHARFATFSGLYPVHDFATFTKDVVPVKSLFEALRECGYETSVFYSSFFDYTNFRDLLRHHGVDKMYDADTMPGTRTTKPVSWGLEEVETLTAINHQIRAYATNDTRFFLTYVPAAPHYPFDGTPSQFRKYESTRLGDYTPRYLNELLYMDWVIANILDELKETGLLDKTLVVITSDHGELLGGDRGDPIGHGWLLTPELANVPLIILDPDRKGYTLNHAVGSQVDLLPTVLDRLGIPLPSGQLYQGATLDRSATMPSRIAYLNSFRQFATLQGQTIACGDRDSNDQSAQSLRDITNAGSRTCFLPSTAEVKPVDIRQFDKFQENFLRHYAAYARTFRATNAIP